MTVMRKILTLLNKQLRESAAITLNNTVSSTETSVNKDESTASQVNSSQQVLSEPQIA